MDYKKKVNEYKEELQITKERLMKQQRSDAQIEVYKNVIDDVQDLKNKL